MANWCENYITFTGDENELNELFTKLNTNESEQKIYESEYYIDNADKFLEMSNGNIVLHVQSKWSPPLDFVERICATWKSVSAVFKYKEQGTDFAGIATINAKDVVDETFGYWEGLYKCFGRDNFFEEAESHSEYSDYDMETMQDFIVQCSCFLDCEDVQQLTDMIMSQVEENCEDMAAE